MFRRIVLRTDDSGISWHQRDSGTGTHLLAVALAHADTGMTVGSNGAILSTFDGGITWIPRPSGATARPYVLSFIDGNDITVDSNFEGYGSVKCTRLQQPSQ